MNKEVLNIHKALCDLKILNKRINEKIMELDVVNTFKPSNPKINGVSVDDWKKNARAKWDSLQSDIKRRDAIKRAINQSNAVTEITIGGTKYTIAEAIDMKQFGVTYLEAIARKLKDQFSRANQLVNMNNAQVENDAAAYAQSVAGGKDKTVQISPESIEQIRKTYYDQHKSELAEAFTITTELEDLQKTIDDFRSEVDSAISVSNAVTTITIEY